jgi:YVTN family beta-propeller protein
MTAGGSRPGRTSAPFLSALALAVAFAAAGVAWAVRGRRTPSETPPRPPAEARSTAGEAPARSLGKVVRDGIEVECRVAVVGGAPGAAPREGEDVRFEFAVADTAGRTPLSGAYPSAWAVSRAEGAPPSGPRESARIAASLIRGSIFQPPDLDLNVFYVVTLNQNATVSVVDPLFGFGGTKLLALVPLSARGDDWVLGPGGRRLFVAIPESNRVAVIDTRDWKVTAEVPGGVRPGRIALQPDGRRLWVAGGVEGGDDSGVTVLDAETAQVEARVRTGRGRHDLAFSDDSRFAFVSNADEGTVSVLDAGSPREATAVKTGRRPYSLAYSARARLAYVSDDLDGTVNAIDPIAGRVVTRINIGAGAGQVRFAPDGRTAFVVNPEKNTVSVIDPSAGHVVQTAKVEEGPDQVVFSGEFAYVRHRGSVNVAMIALKSAGKEGAPLSVVSFPAGEKPPVSPDAPTPAASIVPAPGMAAMLVANPKDRSVYYYKEGLSAPMGTFNNYKREPRAVLVIDRSLRERTRPGVYETTVRVDRPGKFDVIFFLDQPRIVHAFPLDVKADPALARKRDAAKVEVRSLVPSPRTEAGQTFRPLFELAVGAAAVPKPGLSDVEILMFRVGGGWQQRLAAAEVAPAVYGADFRPSLPGVYHVSVACGSLGLTVDNPDALIVHVEEPRNAIRGSLVGEPPVPPGASNGPRSLSR